ncbi:hypothetical protein [Duganella hordei]|uniref:hypothetical protein n=1 Tax=Duganella hordei TaxID=2865934 RepID=UPI0030E893A5
MVKILRVVAQTVLVASIAVILPTSAAPKPAAAAQATSSPPPSDARPNDARPVANTLTIVASDAMEKEKTVDHWGAEWWAVYVNVAMFVATAVLAIFTWRLWVSTNQLAKDSEKNGERQATEVEESMRITRVAADAAAEQAKTAREALLDSKASSERQANEMEESLRITKVAADAAAEQAKTARETLVRSNRPWVGVGQAVGVNELLNFKVGASCAVNLTFKNLGQSPAMRITLTHRLLVTKPDTDPRTLIEDLGNVNPLEGFGIPLLPGETYSLQATPLSCLPTDMPPFAGAPVEAWYTGRVSYWDQFDGIHHSTFMFKYKPNMPGPLFPTGQVNGQFEVVGIGWANT